MKIKIKEVHAILGEPDGAQPDRLEASMEGKRKSMIKIKIAKSGEKLKGGAGDNKPDSAFDPKQLSTGIGDETGEHTPNKKIGKEIAKDHLSQDPDYYKKLKAAGIDEAAAQPLFKKYHNNLLKRGWDLSNAEEIGSGFNGIAYKFGGDKVLKITTDESEIRAANHVKGKDLKHIIHIYDTFSFAQTDDYERWYGIVADLAGPIRRQEKTDQGDSRSEEELFGNYIYFIANKVNLKGQHVDNPWKMNWQVLRKRVLQNCFDDQEDIQRANEAFAFMEELKFPDLFVELKNNGIEYRDVHEDNFKMKNGNIVLIDLGGQTKSPGAMPPVLKEKLKESTATDNIIKWKNSRWMFLDTETTGLPPDKNNPTRKAPRVVQIGYAIVDNMEVVEVFSELVDPGVNVEIAQSAIDVHHIDRERLLAANAKPFANVLGKIKNSIESCDVIMTYNNTFDRPVIEREFQLAGVEIPKKPWLDPMVWMMKHLPIPRHQLKDVVAHYAKTLDFADRAHDAGEDSKEAALATIEFMKTFDGLPDDAEQLANLQGGWAQELKAARIAAFKNKQRIKEANQQQKNFFVLVGPPAVGKSTWIKKNFTNAGKDFKVISNDDIIENVIFPKYGLTAKDIWSKGENKSPEAIEAFKEVRRLIADRIKEVVSSGTENIIVDGIGATVNSRKLALNIAKSLPDYKKTAVVFEFAGYEDQIIQRDAERAKSSGGRRAAMNPDDIKKAMTNITTVPPSKAEGFDEVVSYNSFKEPQMNEAKLSSYWKARAARRAKNASRNWPNGPDRQWALSQQNKSQNIDDSIQNIFQKELEEAEEMIDDVDQMMYKVYKARSKIKMRKKKALFPLSEINTPEKEILAVFDFDDTLFKTSEVSERWKVDHPGVHPMRDESSIPDDHKPSDWISQTVKKAQEMIANPKVITVLMTGRTKEIFESKLARILGEKGLSFAAVYARPDKEKKVDVFKKKEIYNILNAAPNIKKLIMWDDDPKMIESYKKEFGEKIKLVINQVTY